MDRPLFIYDGDCGFCRRWVERWRAATGDSVDYAPSQDVAERFPAIPAERFRNTSVLIEPDGTVSYGAAAVFRALASPPRSGRALWAYRNVPGFAFASEHAYALVSNHRYAASRLTRLLWGKGVRPPAYRLIAWLFLRGIALVYLIAFLSLWVQIEGLVGSEGILPTAPWLDAVRARLGAHAYWQAPTLFWLGASDLALHLVCAAGVASSVLMLANFLPGSAAVACWVLYLSLYTVGRNFLSFQWDILLLEAGVIAVLLAPWRLHPGLAVAVPRAPLWLARWLVFRVMFLSGAVKLLSNDPAWRDLSAMAYHFETQPLPAWTSWYAHQLPMTMQRASTAMMFVVELVLPFLIFAPRRLRVLAFFGFVGLQLGIAATGNYGFFNLLTIVLCITLLDDAHVARLFRARGRSEAAAAAPAKRPWPLRVIVTAAVVYLFAASAGNLVGRVYDYDAVPEIVRRAIAATAPLHLTSNYGLFAVMTKERPEIVIEGSRDGRTWLPYELRWKPGDQTARPRFVQPHMPRLDWQMWFAALGGYRSQPWFMPMLDRLLEGAEPVVDLFASGPFPDGPPTYVRATVYEYRFTRWNTPEAGEAWWVREEGRPYSPVLRRRP